MLSSIDIYDQLKQLFAGDEVRILTHTGGGNSKVFCVQAHGKKWAVKSYPPYAPNQRDRLTAEYLTYQFLNQHHVSAVPTLKSCCEASRWLVIDWIDGTSLESYTTQDIDQAIAFLRQIAQLNTLSEAKSLPLAAEACLSLNILVQQITKRVARLSASAENEPELQDFLGNVFSPFFMDSKQHALENYHQHDMNIEYELPAQHRSLIPADFGFHNSLKDASGRLYFFDFDYFGWDDPVKLLADIIWHPKMHLSDAQRHQFIAGISTIYHTDPFFLRRFYYTLPLFGLRWVLILLNEFIPAFWQNRQHAEAHQNQAEAKKFQLKRAKELLKQVQLTIGSFSPRPEAR